MCSIHVSVCVTTISSPISVLEEARAFARQAIMTRLRIWMAKHHQPPPTHFDHLSGVEKARAIARQAIADRLEERIAPKGRSGEGYTTSEHDDGDLPHAYQVVDASHIPEYFQVIPISLGVLQTNTIGLILDRRQIFFGLYSMPVCEYCHTPIIIPHHEDEHDSALTHRPHCHLLLDATVLT